uniref:RING-type domain-containing protein n=1 Tax=Caenorhabditis tropicalis TaxID=1561998 RepID=A0A1I7TRI0_9PELO
MPSTTTTGPSSSTTAEQESLAKQLSDALAKRTKLTAALKKAGDSVERTKQEIAGIDEKLSTLLECTVCTLKYDKMSRVPLILTCGHTGCARCVARLVSMQSGGNKTGIFKLRCFHCRQPTNETTGQFDIELFSINKALLCAIPDKE